MQVVHNQVSGSLINYGEDNVHQNVWDSYYEK